MLYTISLSKIFFAGAGMHLEDAERIASASGFRALLMNNIIYVPTPDGLWIETVFELDDFAVHPHEL
jgi:hypothetical protein